MSKTGKNVLLFIGILLLVGGGVASGIALSRINGQLTFPWEETSKSEGSGQGQKTSNESKQDEVPLISIVPQKRTHTF